MNWFIRNVILIYLTLKANLFVKYTSLSDNFSVIRGYKQMPEEFSWASAEYDCDNWVWDQYNKSPEVLLSSDQESAYFYTDPVDQSTGTAGKTFVFLLLTLKL